MIRSMTGFGRCQEELNKMIITVEIKSVNHRYFEFSSRLPRSFGFLEEKIKSFVQARVSRGKIECYVNIECLVDDRIHVLVNHSLACAYIDAISEIGDTYAIKNNLSATDISKLPDVMIVQKDEADHDMIWSSVCAVLDKALNSFVSMRESEGERLKADIFSRGKFILENVEYIEKASPQCVKEYHEKLRAKLLEVLDNSSIDEQRILTEAAIYADKIAVDEETVRLRSHIEQLCEFLDSDIAIGRKMDFLIQEINREANTIGSKANNVDIARKVVDIKAEIEKMREQVQNIE